MFNAKDLDDIGELVCKELIEKIKGGNATASDLNVAVTLLRQNGIMAAPKDIGSLVGEIDRAQEFVDSLDLPEPEEEYGR